MNVGGKIMIFFVSFLDSPWREFSWFNFEVFFCKTWLKWKTKAEGFVNSTTNIIWTMLEAREPWTNWKGMVIPIFSPSQRPFLQLRIWYFCSLFLLFTTDLNGLVKFFISTDEINLPRTWVVSFFLCYIKEELLRSEEGEKENLLRVIVLVNNCFCIENYVNKIKENLLGKSIILGPVVSFLFVFCFFSGWRKKFVPQKSIIFLHLTLNANTTHFPLKFYFPLVTVLGQFAYVLCSFPSEHIR